MADLNVTGVGNRIDQTIWKKLTPQEIIKEQSKGEEIPAEIVAWAEQMAAFSKIPDDVTYEQVDGDVGIDALEKLGIEDDITMEAENAQAPEKTEEPDAVKDTDKAEQDEEVNEDEVSIPNSETANEAEESEEMEFTLANTEITADNDEIRKRKERKGIL